MFGFRNIMFMSMQEYKSNMRAIKLFKHSFVIFKALLALCFMGKLLFKTSQTTLNTSWTNGYLDPLHLQPSLAFKSWKLRKDGVSGTNFNFQNSREIKKQIVTNRMRICPGACCLATLKFWCFNHSQLLQVIVTGHRYHYSRDLHNKM